MTKELLNEFIGFLQYTQDSISESIKENDGKIILKGPIQRANAKNQNGRIYPRAVLEREMTNFDKKIKTSESAGELDHPDDMLVNLKNVSHKIIETWWEHDTVMGKVELINTPCGKIAQEIVKAGLKLGISSRGMGSTKNDEDGNILVEDDFELITFDLVSNPSTHKAFLERVEENKEKVVENKKINELNDLIVNILNN